MKLLETDEIDPVVGPATDEQSVLKESTYLDVTYSPVRVPYGEYPYLLARWMLDYVYKRRGRLLDLGCGRGSIWQPSLDLVLMSLA